MTWKRSCCTLPYTELSPKSATILNFIESFTSLLSCLAQQLYSFWLTFTTFQFCVFGEKAPKSCCTLLTRHQMACWLS